MNMAQKGDRVKVDYTGKLQNGEVFVTSNNRPPVQFKIGEGKILPAFEEGVIGMSIGEKKTITVPPEKAFGSKKQDLIVNVGRSTFMDATPEIGKKFGLRMDDGNSYEAVIVRADKELVTLDANHPLAGETLTFDVQLLEIV
jgi:FKBP-type peptidyl-prolyl cis-trans isomerase 2